MVSSKYSKNAAPAVEEDLANNHGRKLYSLIYPSEFKMQVLASENCR
jgi:hypothetical protein